MTKLSRAERRVRKAQTFGILYSSWGYDTETKRQAIAYRLGEVDEVVINGGPLRIRPVPPILYEGDE